MTRIGTGGYTVPNSCPTVRIHPCEPRKWWAGTSLCPLGSLALILAGVFVFRGLWMLLDLVDFMHAPVALWLSLLFGTAVTVWAVRCVMKQQGD